jgi:hypothetical protein
MIHRALGAAGKALGSYGRPMAMGAVAGGVYGAFSDNTSVIGGAMFGAGVGAGIRHFGPAAKAGWMDAAKQGRGIVDRAASAAGGVWGQGRATYAAGKTAAEKVRASAEAAFAAGGKGAGNTVRSSMGKGFTSAARAGDQATYQVMEARGAVNKFRAMHAGGPTVLGTASRNVDRSLLTRQTRGRAMADSGSYGRRMMRQATSRQQARWARNAQRGTSRMQRAQNALPRLRNYSGAGIV